MSENLDQGAAGRATLAAAAATYPDLAGKIAGQPAASATLFLASDASSWITGTTLDIAGGRIML